MKQLNQMRYEGGIDVASIEWNGDSGQVADYLNAFVPAMRDSDMQNFVLLYDLGFRFGQGPHFNESSVRNQLLADFQTFAGSGQYFKNAKYLKFNNKPVVYLYVARTVSGTDDNIRSAFYAIQNAARANGFSGRYLVADFLYWGGINYDKLRLMEPSAITCFAPADASQGVPEGEASRPMRTWADKLSQLYLNAKSPLLSFLNGVDIQPGVFAQYDDRGFDDTRCAYGNLRQVHKWHVLDSTDWTYMIRTAAANRQYIAEVHRIHWDCSESVTSDSNYQSIVWTYSYNEWGEGAGIEELKAKTPRYPYGFGLDMLTILKQEVP